jgi:hypothetical protein
MKPFVIEVINQTAPDLAFGAAQRKSRTLLVGDHATGSITWKTRFEKFDLPESHLKEALTEVALRLVHQPNPRYHGENLPAGYLTDGHGYYVFFGWAKSLEEK